MMDQPTTEAHKANFERELRQAQLDAMQAVARVQMLTGSIAALDLVLNPPPAETAVPEAPAEG